MIAYTGHITMVCTMVYTLMSIPDILVYDAVYAIAYTLYWYIDMRVIHKCV